MYSSPLLLQAAITFSIWNSVNAATDMGPAAFMWPPDREWGAAQDNTPPCGSSQGVTARTKFPMANGAVALVLQDDSFNVTLSIAYGNDPSSNDDFTTVIAGTRAPDVDPGHECWAVPNPPSTTTSGSNATLQLKYVSEFDTKQNETYYACADITYVELADFSTNIPCFNVSVDDPTEIVTSSVGSGHAAATTLSTVTGHAATLTATSDAQAGGSGSGGDGLSKGGIAGAVVGSVVGAAVLFAGAFFLWRRYRQKVARDRAIALRMNELTNPTKPTSSASSEH